MDELITFGTTNATVKSTPEADAAHCWRDLSPRWTYDGTTLWCDECAPGRCGICTVEFWPEGFERPLADLPLFAGLEDG